MYQPISSQYRDSARARAFLLRRGCGGFGCLSGCLSLIVGAILLAGMDVVMDRVTAPWNYATPSRPALTGNWFGTLAAPDGRSTAFTVSLAHSVPSRWGRRRRRTPAASLNLRSLLGTATLTPGPAGAAAETDTLYGSVDRDGNTLHLQMKPPKPQRAGWALDALKGDWDGHSLTFTGLWRRIEPAPNGDTITHSDDSKHPLQVTLHHPG